MTGEAASRGRQIELILERIDRLPTLPAIAVRLMSISSAEEADFPEVMRLIESDPTMTATILGLCRKSGRGGDRIDTVKRAVVMLGFEAVRSAALSVSVLDVMSDQAEELDRRALDLSEADDPPINRQGLWKHAVAVACASEWIARNSPRCVVKPDEAFVAGLLHDLGRMVLELVLPRASARVAAVAERRSSDSAGIERAMLGLDHHTAGKRLAARWGLPVSLQEVIWLHSQPVESVPDRDHKALIGIVTAAKAWCREFHLGWSGDFGAAPDVRKWVKAFDLSPAPEDVGSDEILEAVSDRCRVLRLDDQTAPEMLMASLSAANRRLSLLNRGLREQSSRASRLARALDAISAFHAQPGSCAGPAEAVELIARSASEVGGAAYLAAVLQDEPGAACRLLRFSGGGRLESDGVVDPPEGERIGAASLAALADPKGTSTAAMGVLPWLSDHLSDAPDVRKLRVLPLLGGEQGGDGPVALLLHDGDSTLGLEAGESAALRAAWSAALDAALSGAALERAGEQLAEVARDLAETQGRLSEAETLARLGEMTAGAAHEMNNPLTVIRGRSQLLAKRVEDEAHRADALTIAEAAEHLAELISSLHLLADPPAPEGARTPVAVLIDASLDVVAPAVGGRDRFEVSVECDPALVAVGDARMLTSALAEVVQNAVEAGGGSLIRIRAHRDELDGRVWVSVKDSGPGLSPRARKHAFDPFFSEKPAGRRTGLGLSRARRLLELNGGDVLLENAVEGGARVTLSIPAPARQKPAAPVSSAA
ncbi:MAG: HDOD domain-containing protein [Planctomycetota bacterium]